MQLAEQLINHLQHSTTVKRLGLASHSFRFVLHEAQIKQLKFLPNTAEEQKKNGFVPNFGGEMVFSLLVSHSEQGFENPLFLTLLEITEWLAKQGYKTLNLTTSHLGFSLEHNHQQTKIGFKVSNYWQFSPSKNELGANWQGQRWNLNSTSSNN